MTVHFVKIDINPQLKNAIGEIQAAYTGPAWFSVEKLHVTLIASQDTSFTEQQISAYKRIAEQVISAFIQQNGPIRITSLGNIKLDNNNTFAKLPIITTPDLGVLQSELKTAFSTAPELAGLAFNYDTPHITVARQPGKFGAQSPFTDQDQKIITNASTDFGNIALSHPLLGDNISVCTAFNAPPIATIPNSSMSVTASSSYAPSSSSSYASASSSAPRPASVPVSGAPQTLNFFQNPTIQPERIFTGFATRKDNTGRETRYYISHTDPTVMQNLSETLYRQCGIAGRSGNPKHVFTENGVSYIILIDSNFPSLLLQGYTFNAQTFAAPSGRIAGTYPVASSSSAPPPSAVSQRWVLINPQPLRDYAAARSLQGEGITLFGGSSKIDKINATNKLIEVVEYYNQHGNLQGLTVAPLSDDERKALIKGALFDNAVNAIVSSNPLIYTWVYNQPAPVSTSSKPLGKS